MCKREHSVYFVFRTRLTKTLNFTTINFTTIIKSKKSSPGADYTTTVCELYYGILYQNGTVRPRSMRIIY